MPASKVPFFAPTQQAQVYKNNYFGNFRNRTTHFFTAFVVKKANLTANGHSITLSMDLQLPCGSTNATLMAELLFYEKFKKDECTKEKTKRQPFFYYYSKRIIKLAGHALAPTNINITFSSIIKGCYVLELSTWPNGKIHGKGPSATNTSDPLFSVSDLNIPIKPIVTTASGATGKSKK